MRSQRRKRDVLKEKTETVEKTDSNEIKWYVLNLRYVRSASLAPVLQGAGIRAFVPPVVTNLLFAQVSLSEIEQHLRRSPLCGKVFLMRSRSTGDPLVVRDADMDLFIRICEAASDAPIILTEPPVLKIGDRVRITSGPFAGAEGNVVRMKKSKRVLISISDVVWVATAYIPPAQLELVEKDGAAEK